jgi:hypothetical protein
MPLVIEEFLKWVKSFHIFYVLKFTSSKSTLEMEESKAFEGIST